MLRFKSFITEGGNISVPTNPNEPKGEKTSAAPFPVTAGTRHQVRSDIHHALTSMADTFHKEHGEHLFGQDHQRLHDATAYTGSTHDLMGHHVTHAEFAKHKPMIGDVDTQVTPEHKEKLADHLTAGKKFGKYTVVGTKKHGNEISAVMKHENGEHHQFDFQGVHHPGSEASRFLHGSNWEDTKAGIKGAHHKILLNAVGGDTHKFSITHGLRSRTDENDPGVQHPHEISKKLFGANADHDKIQSFQGVTQLIKKHIPKEQHQAIYDKFKGATAKIKGLDNGPALAHMRKHLGVHDTVNEAMKNDPCWKGYEMIGKKKKNGKEVPNCVPVKEEEEHHVHVSYLGASPFPHMGHHTDIGGSMDAAPHGKKFIGLSGKSDAFSDKEREDIANKQSGGKVDFQTVKSPGITIAKAHASMPATGKKILHLHFGHDRQKFAEGLKHSVENGKIPELEGHKFDEVHVHLPKDENRSHGLSGTKMRQAAAEGDINTFKKHVGPNFSDKEAKGLMDRTRVGLMAGKIKVKR